MLEITRLLVHSGTVVTLIAAIAFPFLLFIGGIAAWQMSKHADAAEQNTWRDDSLDDWRRERDAEVARARAERLNDLRQYEPPTDAAEHPDTPRRRTTNH